TWLVTDRNGAGVLPGVDRGSAAGQLVRDLCCRTGLANTELMMCNGQAACLIGRAREEDVITRLLDGVSERGASLVVRGEAGVGKSALLAAAYGMAIDRGMQVLSTAGVQSETDLPFAGLQQLLRPLLSRVDELPPLQRNAMSAAFGISDDAAPDLFLIALAA